MSGLDKPVALSTVGKGHDHTRPNTFGPQGLVSLDGAFAAGADLSGVAGIADPKLAREIAQTGHKILRRLIEVGIRAPPHRSAPASGGGW